MGQKQVTKDKKRASGKGQGTSNTGERASGKGKGAKGKLLRSRSRR
jgi:hypothetical protein